MQYEMIKIICGAEIESFVRTMNSNPDADASTEIKKRLSESDFLNVLYHIGQNINSLFLDLVSLKAQNDLRLLSSLAPYIGRSLIEVAFTALVGRIDPFRVLLIKRSQEGKDYSLSKPSKLAFNFKSDLYECKQLKTEISDEHDFFSISRSFFGQPIQKTIMVSSIAAFYNLDSDSVWITDALKNEQSKFIAWISGQIRGVYSRLSKGVHREFVIPPDIQYDLATLKNDFSDSLRYISLSAMLVNLSDLAQFRLADIDLLNCINILENIEVFP